MDMWMSELHIFKWKESLISSQVIGKVKASNINVLTSPLDFALLVWFYVHPLILRLSQYLSANPPTVRSHFHLMWEYLVTRSFLKMFFSEWYTKCLYICLIPPQWVLRGAKCDS